MQKKKKKEQEEKRGEFRDQLAEVDKSFRGFEDDIQQALVRQQEAQNVLARAAVEPVLDHVLDVGSQPGTPLVHASQPAADAIMAAGLTLDRDITSPHGIDFTQYYVAT